MNNKEKLIVKLLKSLDPDYYWDGWIENGITRYDILTSAIATWAFDSDIGFHDEGFHMLNRIYAHFGKTVTAEVFRRLCFREHDT